MAVENRCLLTTPFLTTYFALCRVVERKRDWLCQRSGVEVHGFGTWLRLAAVEHWIVVEVVYFILQTIDQICRTRSEFVSQQTNMVMGCYLTNLFLSQGHDPYNQSPAHLDGFLHSRQTVQ